MFLLENVKKIDYEHFTYFVLPLQPGEISKIMTNLRIFGISLFLNIVYWNFRLFPVLHAHFRNPTPS